MQYLGDQFADIKTVVRYLDEDELVILRQCVEPRQTLGELHDLLDCRGHAESDVVPKHGAHVRRTIGRRRRPVFTSAAYDSQELLNKKTVHFLQLYNQVNLTETLTMT